MKVIIESTNQVIKVFSAVGNGESGKYALLAEEAAVRAELAETGAENAENNAAGSATQAGTQAGLSEAWAEGTEPGGVGTKSSKEWAEDAETEAESVPILLGNFFDPAIIALNSRIVTDGATVDRKLYIVQIELGELTNQL